MLSCKIITALMAGRKRKKAALEGGESPSKKHCPAITSSPLKPLPKPTVLPLLNRPAFDRIQLLPSDRDISPNLPQNLFDVFALFCPASAVDNWVKYINERRQEEAWQPTYKEEVYLFFSVLIYMSFCPLPSIRNYWDTSPRSAIHPITRFLSRDRFYQFYRRFYTWDTKKAMVTVFDKIKNWSNHIQQVSTTFWKPSSNISVDEAMVRFTGKSKDIVHLHNQPIPIGYKIWVAADSGYFLHWIFHSKGNGPVEYDGSKYPDLAPTQGVVAQLLEMLPPPPSPQHGYHCFMDNLFTTPQLLMEPRNKGIAATGTTRPNRIHSKQLTTLKAEDKTKDSIPWGTVYARKNKSEEVMQFGFKDNAFVLLLSTVYDGWEPPIKMLRRQPAKSSTSARTSRAPFQGEPTKILEIPQLTNAYNNHMNGVDIGDQLRSAFQAKRRIKRGGQQALLYLFLLEVAVTNTYLLQRYGWSTPITSQSIFRQRLYSQIFERFGQQVALQNKGLSTSEMLHQKHEKARRSKRGYCAFCSSKRRNTVFNQSQLSKAPLLKFSVITGCNQCNVALCNNSKRSCWDKWHSHTGGT